MSQQPKCPCGSGKTYARCCKPLHTGKKEAETAEQLMRSRYAAYAQQELDYIFETTHPESREDYDPESTRVWSENSTWDHIEIVQTHEGGAEDEQGQVEFIAHFQDRKGRKQMHHEMALFEKADGKWYFKDGRYVSPKPVVREAPKVGRNEPCPCGSGKKFKKCCAD